jgi:hypothetical protein
MHAWCIQETISIIMLSGYREGDGMIEGAKTGTASELCDLEFDFAEFKWLSMYMKFATHRAGASATKTESINSFRS